MLEGRIGQMGEPQSFIIPSSDGSRNLSPDKETELQNLFPLLPNQFVADALSSPPNFQTTLHKRIHDRRQDLLKLLSGFAGQMNYAFIWEFLNLLNSYEYQYRNVKTKLNGAILPFLLEKKFLSPQFTALHGRFAKNVLEESGFSERPRAKKGPHDWNRINNESLLFIFEFPKPLAQYWWKGGSTIDNRSKEIEGKVVEWGHFYRQLLPVVHDCVNNQREFGLDLLRLNGKGEHESLSYYYIWKAMAR